MRPTKNKGSVIGGRRDPDQPRKGLTPGGPLKKVGNTKRGREERLLRLLKILVIQETHEATGVPVEELQGLQLDHIFGRNDPRFQPLGAMLSPTNVQLITAEQHREKTNPTPGSGISDRHDFRPTSVVKRLTDLEMTMVYMLGLSFTLKEVQKVMRNAVYRKARILNPNGTIEGDVEGHGMILEEEGGEDA